MRAILGSFIMLVVSLVAVPSDAQQACVPRTTFDRHAKITWQAPPLPAGMSLSYILERRDGEQGAWITLPAPAPTATTATDLNLAPGAHYYRLSAQVRLDSGGVATSEYASPGPNLPCITVTVVPAPLRLEVEPFQ